LDGKQQSSHQMWTPNFEALLIARIIAVKSCSWLPTRNTRK